MEFYKHTRAHARARKKKGCSSLDATTSHLYKANRVLERHCLSPPKKRECQREIIPRGGGRPVTLVNLGETMFLSEATTP